MVRVVPCRVRSALLTRLDGLPSDELFAIPAHPHGAGLRQSSMALEKIRGVPSRERARTTSNPNLSVRAGPRRRAVSSAELLSVAVCAQGLTKTACRPDRTANSHRTDSKRTMRRPARAKPVDRPTRDPVLTRRVRIGSSIGGGRSIGMPARSMLTGSGPSRHGASISPAPQSNSSL